jgi:hypothetical protein|tara:strand:- start:1101 stop:1283 length:183 start_codon:yes stop_codon:yes gene_type:complete
MAGTIGKKSAILKYFKSKNQKLPEFMKELKELSKEDELELAVGAARGLGLTADQVNFPIE